MGIRILLLGRDLASSLMFPYPRIGGYVEFVEDFDRDFEKDIVGA